MTYPYYIWTTDSIGEQAEGCVVRYQVKGDILRNYLVHKLGYPNTTNAAQSYLTTKFFSSVHPNAKEINIHGKQEKPSQSGP